MYQQPIAGLTLLALCCPIGGSTQSECGFPSRCCALFPSVTRPITRPADHRRQGHAHGSCRVHGRASLDLDEHEEPMSMMRGAVFFCVCFLLFFKITNHENNFEFSNYRYPTPIFRSFYDDDYQLLLHKKWVIISASMVPRLSPRPLKVGWYLDEEMVRVCWAGKISGGHVCPASCPLQQPLCQAAHEIFAFV